MSIILPEIEYVDRSSASIRYLEHGWPSDLCRWHSHEEYELHLVVRTAGRAFIGNYVGDFTPGSLFLTGPQLPHNWITDRAHGKPVAIRDMLVQFNQKSIDALSHAFPEFADMQEMFDLSRNGIEFIGFNATFARGHLESIRDTKGPERIVSFLRFLLRIHEHAEKKILSSGSVAQFQGNSKHARICATVEHISKNYAEDISLAIAADMAGMSPSAFSRHFRVVTGKTFIGFVNTIRVAQACTLLYASDDPVSSICYAAGFQNLANFNRCFLRAKGMTPTEYRRVAREELIATREVSA